MMQRYIILWRKFDYRDVKDAIDYTEISVVAMKETGQFIQEYWFRFLSYPKAKHDFTIEHFVLWEKDTKASDKKYAELYEIIEWFSRNDYTCRRNPISLQTIPLIIHYHIAKFKDMDKEVMNLL